MANLKVASDIKVVDETQSEDPKQQKGQKFIAMEDVSKAVGIKTAKEVESESPQTPPYKTGTPEIKVTVDETDPALAETAASTEDDWDSSRIVEVGGETVESRGEWSEFAEYSEGTVVAYRNKAYICKTNGHISESPPPKDIGNWDQLTVEMADQLQLRGKGNIEEGINDLAAENKAKNDADDTENKQPVPVKTVEKSDTKTIEVNDVEVNDVVDPIDPAELESRSPEEIDELVNDVEDDDDDLSEFSMMPHTSGLKVISAGERQLLSSLSLFQDPDMQLPSDGRFYGDLGDDEGIKIRALKYSEQRLVIGAFGAGSMKQSVDAMRESILNYDIKELTEGDFRFVLYTHRKKRAMTQPYTYTWECFSPGHRESVIRGEKTTDSLLNKLKINNKTTKVTIYKPDWKGLKRFFKGRKPGELYKNLFVYPPRVADMIERDLIERELKKNEDDQMKSQASLKESAMARFDYENAQLLSTRHGKTLRERIRFLNKWIDANPALADDVLFKLEEFERLSRHTMIETADVKCKECGVSTNIVISFSPLDLFPEKFRERFT